MLAVMCLTGIFNTIHLTPDGPKLRPAPIPDRWLLKYTPRDLPQLPATFFDTQWFYGFNPRSMRGAYSEWTIFERDSFRKPPEVTIIHSGRGFAPQERAVTERRVPLAVWGPLVEYDGLLHTVALTNWEEDFAKDPRWALNLGSAVEVRKNIWYQAGSDRFTDGKIRVREYRLEFADDPRTAKTGRVKVFGSERMTHEYGGEVLEADAKFEAVEGKPNPRRVVITIKVPGGVRHVRLTIGDGYYPSVIDGVSRTHPAVLTAAPSPAPKPPNTSAPGLMQPPKKK